jgi:UDP-GlcNAc:undecaprenyl-phosphate GlcNAc-1-phosphate transferase
MQAWLIVYGGVFATAMTLSLALCGLARRIGLRLGWLDRPGGHKAHAIPVAVTGGYGIFATFSLLAGGGFLMAGPAAHWLPDSLATLRPYLANLTGVRSQAAAVLGGAAILFVAGAIDDRHALGPKTKLAIQSVAVVPLLLAGVTVRGYLPLPLGWLMTVVWVVLLTNSFNLLDNMDGLSASVAMVVCLALSLAAAQGGELWLPALFLTLAGALAGFLRYNWHPARMFMGDAGSMPIGYLAAVFSVMVTWRDLEGGGGPTPLPALMPLAVMGVPLFDTLSVMWIRWRTGKPLMVGDRNHFSHRLLAMGFSTRGAALTIASLTAATGLMALPLRWLPWPSALLHLTGLVLLFGVIAALELAGRTPSAH